MKRLAVLTLLAGACHRPLPPRLYVSDEDSGVIVVLDPATAKIEGRIAVGKRPRGVRLSRDGKTLYVALSGSPRGGPGVDESKLPPGDRTADGIGVVDVATRKLLRTIESGQDPETFEVSLDDRTLFVSNEETAEMSVVDVASGKVRARVPVGHEPEGVTLSADGKRVYVTSEADSNVTVIDTETLAPIATIAVGPRPRNIILARDGKTAFSMNESAHTVSIIDLEHGRATGTIAIDTNSPMPIGVRPMNGVVSADGTQLYVTTGRGGSLAFVDLAMKKQVRSIDGVGDRPWGLALSADGKTVYTANGTSHDVSFTNLATGNVDHRVATGGLPWGIVLSTAGR